MKQNYDMMIEEKVLRVLSEMEKRVSIEDMARIHEAYELAREAHAEAQVG